MKPNTTIAAVSTPHGEGGIAVLRISGPDAIKITSKILKTKKSLASYRSRGVFRSQVYNKQDFIDDVIVTIFRSPKSYTGENTIELSCHGSPYIAGLILELLIKNGAVLAEPGEFTKRAFLNGKMDLAQAEAVADIIRAKTESSRRVAAMQLKGHLSTTLSAMREDLIKLSSLLEIELDFSEEDIEFAPREHVSKLLQKTKSQLAGLIKSFERGQICRDGINMVITGLPNVGKSSILNGLAERERAIVTDLPGTTRDTIEEVLDIEGVQVKIIDTAGIRRSKNPIEQKGVKRAKNAVSNADLVLLILDGSQIIGQEERDLTSWVADTGKDVVCIVNKADLPQKASKEGIKALVQGKEVLYISALKQNGIKILIDKITAHALKKGLPRGEELLITRARHKKAVEKALMHISKVEESLKNNMSQEFLALDMRGAADAIGSITGKISTDNILNNIFSDFCIGK